MRPRRICAPAVILSVLFSLSLLTACGGGSTQTPVSNPIFTSVPVTAATQGVAYAYQVTATDPAGGAVTFSLTTGPTGAALTGNTVNWTPTAAQSRVSNSFTIKATTTSGGTASQSWSVTPGGTITVNWTNTYWTASGAVQVPEPASASLNIAALVANPDGSLTVEKSSAASPGVFTIPNVPAGYYWLVIGPAAYWTSTGSFDAGRDLPGAPAPRISDTQPTTLAFSLSGLDSVPEVTPLEFAPPVQGVPGFWMTDSANSTVFNSLGGIGTVGIDWTQVTSAYLLQYKPESVGSLNNKALDYWVDAPLSLINDTQNLVTATLGPSPETSVALNVPGASQWSPLFSNAAPSTPTPFASAISVSTETYLSNGMLSSVNTPQLAIFGNGTQLMLAGTTFVSSQGGGIGFVIAGPVFGTCDTIGFPQNPNSSQPAILTDQNFGTLQYGDPFPVAWTRTFSLCQEATVPIPIPNSSATADFVLVDGVTVAPSSSPLVPLVSTVQNPTINGASLFSAATLNTAAVTLSWAAPATGAPYGYRVLAFVQTALPTGVQTYASAGEFFTAKTSITLPPLSGGNTYVFAITSAADGAANAETAPARSALPTGFATVVSAPITVSPGTMAPAIRGDRRVVARLSQAQRPPAH
jgi:hypothetical protein